MARVEGEIVINRPVEEVFDFVADERNEPRHNRRMRHAEQISEGPIGLGTRWSWEVRPRGALRLMAPLVGVIGRRQEQRIWGDLKRLLESTRASEAGSSA